MARVNARAPLNPYRMKRILLPFLGLFVIFAGCTWFEEEAEVETDIEDEVEVDEETEVDVSVQGETVEFYDPVEWPFEDVLAAHEDYFKETMPEYYEERGFEAYKTELLDLDLREFWAAGTFISGKYEGQTLVVGRIACDGPCFGETFMRYAVDERSDEWTLLVPYSDETDTDVVHMETVAEDLTIEIPELDAPENLEIYEDTALVLLDASYLTAAYFEENTYDYYSSVELDSDAFSTYYESENGCIYGVTPDGLVARYMVVPGIFSKAVQDYATFNQDLSFTSEDGEEVTREYALFSSGCGFSYSCVPSYAASASEEAGLEVAGTLNGETVYWLSEVGEEPETYEDSLLRTYYNAYNNYKVSLEYDTDSTEELMSAEDYLKSGNFFFIKLDNGEYVNVFNAQHAPVAECGKPVIYLYPEKTTVVSVKVGVDEITKSEPAYGNGWLVKADPTGTLLNLVDGMTYPYLFWEGNSDKNIPLGEGFTLAKTEVDAVLPAVLKSLGLSAQETADFMEFWSPELTAVNAPYIQFNFVGNKEMDIVAPLRIFPKPDQVIRIFMYFQGASEPGLPVPNFKPAARHGYTVVEWGGTLY